MKKVTTLVAVMLFAAASTFGQGIDIGLKAGLNIAKLDISGSAFNESNRTGFHFGAFATFKLPGGIGIQPEAYYSVQGSDLSFASAKAEISTKYLQIPILLRFSPVPILNFHIGPQFGILLNGEFDDGTSVQDIKNDLKSSDLSLAAGVGLDLPMGINFTLRYVKGLSDINDVAANDSIKGSIIQVSVGYKLFSLGK